MTIALMAGTLFMGYSQEIENRPVSPFNAIKTDGLVRVYLQPGDKESLRIEVKGIALRDIISTVENGMLTIKTEGTYNEEDIKVYVTYQQLNSISVGGSSKLYGQSTITGEELKVATSGSGDAFLTVDLDTLKIKMEEAGNLKIAGKANSGKINVSNLTAGNLDRSDLIILN